jgi:hypothetical protein
MYSEKLWNPFPTALSECPYTAGRSKVDAHPACKEGEWRGEEAWMKDSIFIWVTGQAFEWCHAGHWHDSSQLHLRAAYLSSWCWCCLHGLGGAAITNSPEHSLVKTTKVHLSSPWKSTMVNQGSFYGWGSVTLSLWGPVTSWKVAKARPEVLKSLVGLPSAAASRTLRGTHCFCSQLFHSQLTSQNWSLVTSPHRPLGGAERVAVTCLGGDKPETSMDCPSQSPRTWKLTNSPSCLSCLASLVLINCDS